MASDAIDPKQPTEAAPEPADPHAGWLTRAQVAVEFGYRSIFPVRKMEGQKLHPVRSARGWLFDPAEVDKVRAKRPIAATPVATPAAEGRIAARVFRMFDTAHDLRDVVEQLEVSPALVRDLWHEWMTDLYEGETTRRQTAQEARQRRAEEEQRRELERLEEKEEKNFATIMAAIGGEGRGG